MHVGVIGGGSIGLLVAAQIGIDHKVTVYVRRQEQKEEINREGLFFLPAHTRSNVSALLVSEIKQEEMMFVCVKQYHLRHLYPYLQEIRCPIIFLQNGMGHVGYILRYQNKQTILVGTCEHGAIKVNDRCVKQTGEGKINIASVTGDKLSLTKVIDSFHRQSFPIVIKEDWYKMLGEKLIINAVVNPLTALFQVKNGEILKNPYLTTLAKALCKETCDVLGLVDKDQWDNVVRVIRITKENESSMKLDIMNNRKSEIEGICGYLLTHTKVDTPNLQFMYEAIRALEHSKGVVGK
ncbi:2-dehydropantoate 2-reductase [Aquibacillus albus]|uniref:2-dehydropantoate 2-reductase n=1 Tax=Aquibacillus albus TaxID=1168171 RepID=A0ABS2N0P3_9BACI|nr:2-dehydropantoate 2-reductase [Aquibacillus albus]MBM7571723.1 2-dehydropantoate 2-reductase [Aquibacillus albus]